MSDLYNVVQLFSGYMKNPPKIIYKPLDVMIVKAPSINQDSGIMTVTWSFPESPSVIHESSVRI